VEAMEYQVGARANAPLKTESLWCAKGCLKQLAVKELLAQEKRGRKQDKSWNVPSMRKRVRWLTIFHLSSTFHHRTFWPLSA